eukprot:gene3141-17805_t
MHGGSRRRRYAPDGGGGPATGTHKHAARALRGARDAHQAGCSGGGVRRVWRLAGEE